MKVINREKIKEDLDFLIRLEKETKHKKLSQRLQMLIILKKNPKLTLKEVCNFIPVHYSTLVRWWNYYKEGGLEKLLDWKVEGYKVKMTKEQEEEFLKELEKGEFETQQEMIIWIEERYGIKYSQQGISDLLKRLKVKKKVARPTHPNKDEEEGKKFKEEFKKIAKKNKEIFF